MRDSTEWQGSLWYGVLFNTFLSYVLILLHMFSRTHLIRLANSQIIPVKAVAAKSAPKQMNPLKHNPTWKVVHFLLLDYEESPSLENDAEYGQKNEMEHVPPFITQVPLLEHWCLNPRKLQIIMPPKLRCNSFTITTPETETLQGVFKNWLLAHPAHVDGIGAHLKAVQLVQCSCGF